MMDRHAARPHTTTTGWDTQTRISPWRAFRALVARDLKLATAQGAGGLQVVVFFAVVVTLIPFGLGPDVALLQRIAPGLLWVALILASLLTFDRLFQADFEDGSLDGLVCGPLSMEGVVLAKACAHWLTNALPLIVATPVLALLLNMDMGVLGFLILTLLVGTPGLTLIGALGAGLSVGVRRAGILIALLVMPLYVPVLIFAIGAIEQAQRNLDAGGGLNLMEPNALFLAAASLVAGLVGVLAAAAGLRLHIGG